METPPRPRLRYAVIGTGNRCQMYIEAMLGDHADVAQLVAVADTNPGRAAYYVDAIEQTHGVAVQTLDPADLAAEIGRWDIDRVIVTTPDFTHADLVCTALEAGADVVVEKPLTIDAGGCARINAAVRATGRSVLVTFNYRYSPRNTALKRAIAAGTIGQVTSIDFTWMLDTVHGADYFRRWHRVKENSGGLLVHKASHHFDLVNWWIDDAPQRVYAAGGLRFYGDENAAARGQGESRGRGTREGSADDPFALDLRTDSRLCSLYLENEAYDGYQRDQDVFASGINIEDNLALTATYASGAVLSYSLNAHSPWEGYRVAVNGTAGRLELDVVERAAVLPTAGGSPVDPSATADGQDGQARRRGERLLLQRHWEQATELAIESGEGSHGGGDRLLLSDVFRGPGEDPLARTATLADGIAAIAVGIAGNASLDTGTAVDVEDLGLDARMASTDGPTSGSAVPASHVPATAGR